VVGGSRGERAFCEELDYKLLFRWFLDMALIEPSFDQTKFSKNRQRLLKHEVARRFFDEVVRHADALSSETRDVTSITRGFRRVASDFPPDAVEQLHSGEERTHVDAGPSRHRQLHRRAPSSPMGTALWLVQKGQGQVQPNVRRVLRRAVSGN
jgi:hypothetical protein